MYYVKLLHFVKLKVRLENAYKPAMLSPIFLICGIRNYYAS